MTEDRRPEEKKPVAGVIGWPIGHSRSPIMHNLWLEEAGIEGAYVPVAIRPEDLEKEVNLLKEKGFYGFNATIPHKEAIFGLVDEMDEAARTIGAVNTVVIRKDGTLYGLNTDGPGFTENLSSTRTNWQQGTALILGAGGAARAIVYGLAMAGVPRILIFNRTESRARNLAAEFQNLGAEVEARPWSALGSDMNEARLLVNTTSLGMTGEPELEIDLSSLPENALVTDIVYVPLKTALLRQAEERGLETVDGLGMLIHQARFAFEAWFGVLPEASEKLRRMLEDDLEK